jgi:hypothetical protein
VELSEADAGESGSVEGADEEEREPVLVTAGASAAPAATPAAGDNAGTASASEGNGSASGTAEATGNGKDAKD